MALGQRKVKRRIFEKAGSGKDRMDDNKIAKLSASFAANIHIDHPELPDATEGILYAIQGVEEDVEELHRYLSNDDLAVNITGNAATATALTAGNKTLNGNFTLDTGHTLTTPFIQTYQIAPVPGVDTDLMVISNGNIKFTLDNDTTKTGQSFTFRNHNGMGNYTDLANLNESGDLLLYGSINLGHADTTVSRSAAGEVSIEGSKIVTENSVKHVLNCGWNGNATVLQWLPFGYGGTGEAYYYSSNSGYLEMGGFVAPCNGHVDFVVIRAENAAGYSTVGVHVAPAGTEVPATTGTSAFTSPTTNMTVDDTGYKFTNFTNSSKVSNSFSAGDVIMFSFDPQYASGDSVATAVLVLDWTKSL